MDDDSQKFMVHRAVMSSLRLDRGDVADVAMIGKHMAAVVNEAGRRDGDELDRLAQLVDSPAATIRRLRKTPTGCRWIREQFLMLKTRLEDHRSLLDSQRRRLCHLLGRRIEDFLAMISRSFPGWSQWSAPSSVARKSTFPRWPASSAGSPRA